MLEYAAFENFARDLMMFRSNSPFGIKENELRVPVSLMENALFLKKYFADGHCDSLGLIFVKNEYLDLQNDEQFLRYTIPRCLNIVDKERCFYSLMLIAGFLYEFLSRLEESRKCYRFYFTAYKCLLAVFKRSLEESFNSLGGFKSLEKYMQEIMKVVYEGGNYKNIIDNLNQGRDDLCERVVKLIENCDNFDESFHLNDYELSLIRDDDVKNIIELLESDVIDEDPLDLKWPPPYEEMQEVLESFRTPLENYEPRTYDVCTHLLDGCCDSDSDSDESDSLIMESRECTDLEIYMSAIYEQASDRYGYKVFKEKMHLRKCPCCGIKCNQFSRNLYLKQFDLALVREIPK